MRKSKAMELRNAKIARTSSIPTFRKRMNRAMHRNNRVTPARAVKTVHATNVSGPDTMVWKAGSKDSEAKKLQY